MLFRGFDDTYLVPHSRHTTTRREDIDKIPELRILSSSKEAGVHAVTSPHGRQFFVTGHSEYDGETLRKEYLRDRERGEEHRDSQKLFFPTMIPGRYLFCNLALPCQSVIFQLVKLLCLSDDAL